jgi:hypothetical protein
MHIFSFQRDFILKVYPKKSSGRHASALLAGIQLKKRSC